MERKIVLASRRWPQQFFHAPIVWPRPAPPAHGPSRARACAWRKCYPDRTYSCRVFPKFWRAIDVVVVFTNQAGFTYAQEPSGHVAADAQSRDRQRAERIDGRILCAARAVRGSDHYRRDFAVPQRTRLSAHPGSFLRRASGRLEARDGCGSRQRHEDFRAVHAHRANRSPEQSAGRCGRRWSVGHRGRRRNVYRR